MLRKLTGLFLLLFVLCHKGFLQNLPMVIKPSPQAQEFVKYGDLPVDLSTGIPSIRIPIYTVNAGNLSLPIDISYHAAGNKVTDIAGTVGLGWTLNAGGIITRSILGSDDQKNLGRWYSSAEQIQDTVSYALTTSAPCNIINFVIDYFGKFAPRQQAESQSDRYLYSLPGMSGVFRLNYQTNQVVTVPYKPIKISLGPNNSGPYSITDMDGTQYIFEAKEKSWVPSSGIGDVYTSSYLTQIIDANNADTIILTYRQDSAVTQIVKNHELEKGYGGSNFPDCALPNNVCNTTSVSMRDRSYQHISYPLLIDSIKSRTALIVFEYESNRPDPRKSRLGHIYIKDASSGHVVQHVQLFHSYFGSAANRNQRLRLDSIYLRQSSLAHEEFKFKYNNTELPPYYSSLSWSDPNDRYAEDYWGYYNGSETSKSLIPKDYIDFQISSYPPEVAAYQSLYGGDRNPNPAYIKAGLIEEIEYPTGGKSVFEFEPNKVYLGYDYSNTNQDVFAGVRLKKLSSYASNDDQPIVKSYSYVSQHLFQPITQDLYKHQGIATWVYPGAYSPGAYQYYNLSTTGERLSITSDPYYPLTTGGNSTLIYSTVDEIYGTDTSNVGKISYSYLAPFHNDYQALENPYLFNAYAIDRGNYQPLITEKTSYRNANGVFTPSNTEHIEYSYLHIDTVKTGIKYFRNNPFIAVGPNASTYEEYDVAPCSVIYWNYDYTNTISILDAPVVSRKRVIEYSDSSQPLSRTYDFAYNEETLQPITVTAEDSKGVLTTTKFKYPSDLQSSGTPNVYNAMVSRNMLKPVISQEYYYNNKFVRSQRNLYGDFGGRVFPSTVEQTVGSNPSTIDIAYHAYSARGNVVSISQHNDSKIAYIWDCQEINPIAEVTNAEVKDVFHTSFEDQAGSVVTGAKTGQKSRNGFEKNLSNLTNGTYILSYWKKIGQQWTLQKDVVSVTTGTFNISLSGQVDEVRFYPIKSRMQTFTYRSLVGVTSETDINNATVYYEYDSLNRLHIVRDRDGNILNKMCYNFHGQPEDCSPTSTSIWRSTGDVRCKPCSFNSTYQSGEQEHLELDMNPNSPTYQDSLWVSNGTNNSCVIAAWQNTATPVRCKAGSTSGEQEQEQVDMNPCSPTYNSSRWLVVGYNLSACPVQTCTNCNAVNKKCINGVCETGTKKYLTSVRSGSRPYVYNNTYVWLWSDCSESEIYQDVTPSAVFVGIVCLQ